MRPGGRPRIDPPPGRARKPRTRRRSRSRARARPRLPRDPPRAPRGAHQRRRVRRRTVARSSKPSRTEPVPVRTVGRTRGHLEDRQVPDEGTAQPPVETEQADQVHGRERRAGQQVDVSAIRSIQIGGGIVVRNSSACIQAGSRSRTRRTGSPSAASWRRRRAADPPRVRVGLLQLVRRPMRIEQLTDLRERRISLTKAASEYLGRRSGQRPERLSTSPAANGSCSST